MWVLVEKGGSERDHLWQAVFSLTPRTVVFGRTEGQIIISDPSVSRRHATLEVSVENENVKFSLRDHSRAGTYVNGEKMRGHSQDLREGDTIEFGNQPRQQFALLQAPLKILLSCMDRANRERVRTIVNLLKGDILSECSIDCNYLVMPYLVVTAKVVCALLCLVPIVSPTFLRSYAEAASRTPFCAPDPSDFLPPIREERLSSGDRFRFFPDKRRKTLFKGKTFFTLTRQKLIQLSQIVPLGEGEVEILDCDNTLKRFCQEKCNLFRVESQDADSLLRRLLSAEGSCVIHDQTVGESKDWQRKVYSALRSIHRRPILESELGFAVIYTSVAEYCNPDARCPARLYKEASISQVCSINPFHMDSQPLPDTVERISTACPKNSDSGNVDKQSSLKSRIVPLASIKRLPKAQCLVFDSEADKRRLSGCKNFESSGSSTERSIVDVTAEEDVPIDICRNRSVVVEKMSVSVPEDNKGEPCSSLDNLPFLMPSSVRQQSTHAAAVEAPKSVTRDRHLCNDKYSLLFPESDVRAKLSPDSVPMQLNSMFGAVTSADSCKENTPPENPQNLLNSLPYLTSSLSHHQSTPPVSLDDVELKRHAVQSTASHESLKDPGACIPAQSPVREFPSTLASPSNHTASPVSHKNTAHFGWLTKLRGLRPSAAENTSTPEEPTVSVCIQPVTRTIDIDTYSVVPKNYKNFKSVCKHRSETYVALKPYEPTSSVSGVLESTESYSGRSEEIERINRLFEQVQQLPLGRMLNPVG
ncbi:unnamed protein product [Calicophoron daubneyi]|uniref:FHA domain-containing protein n=1 Tax=Calicophoron daubneyi TaxID=300641 RepID=A0AAV2T9K2_CALDB